MDGERIRRGVRQPAVSRLGQRGNAHDRREALGVGDSEMGNTTAVGQGGIEFPFLPGQHLTLTTFSILRYATRRPFCRSGDA
jgi:hypothetical protein